MAPTAILFEAFVTFLGVAVTGLDRGALTVAVDAVTGASALLDAPTTSHRTMGPVRPGRPTVLCVVAWWSTARAALSIGHGGVNTWDQRAGDFATHCSRVLAGALSAAIHGPFIFIIVHNAVVDADPAVDVHLIHQQCVVLRHFAEIIRQLFNNHTESLELLKHTGDVLTREAAHRLQIFGFVAGVISPNSRAGAVNWVVQGHDIH